MQTLTQFAMEMKPHLSPGEQKHEYSICLLPPTHLRAEPDPVVHPENKSGQHKHTVFLLESHKS